MVIGIMAEDKAQNAKLAKESMTNIVPEVGFRNGRRCASARWFTFEGDECAVWIYLDTSLSSEADCIEECKIRVTQAIEAYLQGHPLDA